MDNYRPAGYSSEEDSDSDEYCGFSTGSSWKKNRSRGWVKPPTPPPRILTPEEKLEEAVAKEDNDEIRLLLSDAKNQLDVNKFIRKTMDNKEVVERTLLMIAGKNGKPGTMKYLLEKAGALCLFEHPAKKTTLDRYTELMAICDPQVNYHDPIDHGALLECVHLIIGRLGEVQTKWSHLHGVTLTSLLDVQDKYGKTALIYAAKNGLVRIVEVLIGRGANVNICDNHHKTALIHAAENNSGLIARYLLQAGAEPDSKDFNQKNAMDFALEKEMPNSSILDILHYVTFSLWRPGLDPSLMEQDISLIKSTERDAALVSQEREQIEVTLIAEDLERFGPVFETHLISYKAFLQLEEDDLIEMGVSELEDRVKILNVIDSILEREWTAATPLPIDLQTNYTASELTCILLDTAQHFTHMTKCISGLRRVIQKRPEALQMGLEVRELTHLIESGERLRANASKMMTSGRKWQNELDKMDIASNLSPIKNNVQTNGNRGKRIGKKGKKDQKINYLKLIVFFGGIGLAGVIINVIGYKKEPLPVLTSLIERITSFFT